MDDSKYSFKDKGIGSRAWFLQMVKTNPEKTGVNYLVEYKGVSWYFAYHAMNDLSKQGYLKNSGKTGGRPHYQVTSFGHRYLEEHKDELIGTENARPEKATPPEEPATDDAPVKKRIDTRVEKPVFEVSPTGVARETMPSRQAAKQVGEAIERIVVEGDFERRFRRILTDILIERFADQVTAKDILERMKEKS